MSGKVKVLIIRFSSIGDVLLTTPVVRCLKEQLYGESEIHYLVKKPFDEVLNGNPHIDKLHVLNDNLNELVHDLKKENFHYIIDLHKNIRSHLVRNKLKALSFTIRKLNIQKWLLVNLKVDLLPNIHIVDRYFEAVKALGITSDEKGLELFLNKEDEVDVSQKFKVEAENFIAFAIGAAHEGKKLSQRQIEDLCAMIDKDIVLIGGKIDEQVGEDISSKLEHVKNACGKLTIKESASVIKQSRLVITHDSGMMHVASAFQKRIISIWGATVPKFGMYPYLPHPSSVIIEADHLKFRPTSKLGNKNSRKERRTTDEISLNRIKMSSEQLWV